MDIKDNLNKATTAINRSSGAMTTAMTTGKITKRILTNTIADLSTALNLLRACDKEISKK